MIFVLNHRKYYILSWNYIATEQIDLKKYKKIREKLLKYVKDLSIHLILIIFIRVWFLLQPNYYSGK